MRIRIQVLLAAFLLVLAGCVNEAGTYSDVHTGVTAGHSRMYPAASGLLHNLNAAAFVAEQNGTVKYGVGTRYVSTALGWASFREAWSFGKQFSYKVTSETLAGCGGGGCTHIEEGVIELTRAQFESAAKTGWEFKLVGKGTSIVGKLPASAFSEALMHK